MNKHQIGDQLKYHHRMFLHYLSDLGEYAFEQRMNGKWSAGQHLDHIRRSIFPVVIAFLLPKLLLRLSFGQSGRSSRSYEKLVADYRQKLNQGAKSPGLFLPTRMKIKGRKRLARQVVHMIDWLISFLESYSEEELDQYLLPHPLLGKLTLREMLCFTIYHVQHHYLNTRSNIG